MSWKDFGSGCLQNGRFERAISPDHSPPEGPALRLVFGRPGQRSFGEIASLSKWSIDPREEPYQPPSQIVLRPLVKKSHDEKQT
jgi:hypothetical protein